MPYEIIRVIFSFTRWLAYLNILDVVLHNIQPIYIYKLIEMSVKCLLRDF